MKRQKLEKYSRGLQESEDVNLEQIQDQTRHKDQGEPMTKRHRRTRQIFSNEYKTNMRLMAFMKQQLDIGCQGFRKEMEAIIKQQAKQIQRLSKLLQENAECIKYQNKALQQFRLKDKEAQINLAKVKKLEQLAAVLNQIAGKKAKTMMQQEALVRKVIDIQGSMKDIKRQVRLLGEKVYEYDNFQIETIVETLRTVSQKIDKLESALVANRFGQKQTERQFNPCLQLNLSESASNSNETVNRLCELVETMNWQTPLPVEVDQTGYIKSAETGMYLVDMSGNGFEFAPQDLQECFRMHLLKLF